MSDILRQLICNIELMTCAELVSFSLSDLGIITFAFVEEFLELLNNKTWFEDGQSRSSQHVDT